MKSACKYEFHTLQGSKKLNDPTATGNDPVRGSLNRCKYLQPRRVARSCKDETLFMLAAQLLDSSLDRLDECARAALDLRYP